CKGGEGEYRTRCAAAKCVALVHCRGGLLFFLEAVLISPGSMTHASDMHQRYVELSTTVTVTGTTNQVQFVLAANEDLAPRGLYMLWLVTNSEAVSDATWVVLR